MIISLKNRKRTLAVILAFFIVLTSVLGFFGRIDSYAEDVSIVLAIWPTDVKIGDAVTAKEVQKIEKVQEEVKKQRSFVPRVKIDPLIEKYGEIKEGNPVYDAARKASQTEISIKKEDDLLK